MNTPCINVCTLRGGECVGCGRTLEEIRTWALLTDEERDAVMARLGEGDT